MDATDATRSEEEVLASLPPPPSALPDFLTERGEAEASNDDAHDTPRVHRKAFSAARSMAAAARSKLAQSGRKVLSPLSAKSKKDVHQDDTTMADSVTSLTSNLTSSLASASSSFGSLLFSSQSSSVSNVEESEDAPTAAERAADAEILRQVTTQQRLTILEDLVQHRRSDWNYLKAMHEGSNYWLNVALLREQQVMKFVGDKQTIRRGAQFFYLGIGLGRLVGESVHPELLAMDCCQLLEELEFYFSSSTVQGMKMMVATSSTLHEPVDKENSPQYSAQEPFRPTLHKWNQRPVYRRLLTPPIPFPLDYREVLLSLCDILALTYSKLIEDSSSSENVNLFQSIIRFDERIKKLFIDPVKKEFSAVASQVMAEEIRLVRKAYASGHRESEGASASAVSSPAIADTSASESDPQQPS